MLSLVSAGAVMARADERPGAVEIAVDHLTKIAPRHPLQRHPDRLRDLADHISEAAIKHQIPPLFFCALVYRESSFHTTARGDLGEIGLVQIHGRAADGCDLTTAEGQLDCGASWLARCVERCGSLAGGFSLYASGRTCRPDTDHLRRVVADRMHLWQRLERITDGKKN